MKTNHNSSPKNLLLFHLLKAQGNSKSNQEQGYILVVAIGIVLALSGLMALYAKTINQSEQETTTALASSNTGFYAAESALNLRALKLKDIYSSGGTPSGTSPSKADACFSGGDKGSGDFVCEDKTIKSDSKSDTLVTTYVTEKNGGVGVQGIVPQGDAYQGLSMLEVGHSIYALAFKDDINNKSDGKQATAIVQMDIKSRLIPLFQFAAFYTEDLEIYPGPVMTLSGPIHTNGDLYVGSEESLNIKGQVTTVKDIFHGRKHNNGTAPNGRVKISTQIPDDNGLFLKNLLQFGTGSTAQTRNAMDPTRLTDVWGSQIKVQTDAPVTMPEVSILNKDGDYYKKADIRVKYKPQATSTANYDYLNTVPFEITAIDRTGTTPSVVDLDLDQRKSLRQPIMVSPEIASIPKDTPTGSGITSTYSAFHACAPADTFAELDAIKAKMDDDLITGNVTVTPEEIILWNSWEALNLTTTAQKDNFVTTVRNNVIVPLITQIQSQSKPVRFSRLSEPAFITASPTPLNEPVDLLGTQPSGITADEWNVIKAMTPQQIAGLTERCFVSAPITDIGRDGANHKAYTRFVNEREQRNMRILQLNIQSLAIWNHEGVYLNGGSLASTSELLYKKADPDNNAPVNSFQNLGLAAKDTSEDGIVIHATIDSADYPNAKTNQSRYGFALIKGRQLLGLSKTTNHPDPTGMTVATDQGIYVQGDYNVGEKDYHTGQPDSMSTPTTEANAKVRVHNKQPAAFLADTFYPLSETCLNNDNSINHFTGLGCNNEDNVGNNNTRRVLPSHTEQNAAVLSGTEISGKPGAYNGGLQNYPRFLEDWDQKEWRYKGSFVSISTPLYANGFLRGAAYKPPLRPWDYDSDFNDAKNLPPLTPRFVVLKQESFIRSFDQ